MSPALELNRPAPEFRVITEAGARELSSYRGQWLALMYCPRGTCSDRPECLDGLRAQTRAIGAMGGQLLMLHPALASEDRWIEGKAAASGFTSLHVGTILDSKFLERYHVEREDDAGHGITGVFLIDPQGNLRASARYSACAPVVMHEIAALMRTAIERFGLSGTLQPAQPEVTRAANDLNYGCVEWFQYR